MAVQGDYLTRKQAAHYLTERGYSVSPQTMAHWACHKNRRKGPAFYSPSWSAPVSYKRVDLDDWLTNNLRRVE